MDLISVKYWFRLNRFQTQCPMDMAKSLHALGSLVLQAQIFSQPGDRSDRLRLSSIPIQPCRNTVISQLGTIADLRPKDPRIQERPVCVNFHFNHKSQTFLVRIQRGEISRKYFRKHREDHRGGIHRSSIVAGMSVPRSARLYKSSLTPPV